MIWVTTSAQCRKLRLAVATIRTITDPQELLQAQIDEVHSGNVAMREKIKNYRAILRAGEHAEKRLRAELRALREGKPLE